MIIGWTLGGQISWEIWGSNFYVGEKLGSKIWENICENIFWWEKEGSFLGDAFGGLLRKWELKLVENLRNPRPGIGKLL